MGDHEAPRKAKAILKTVETARLERDVVEAKLFDPRTFDCTTWARGRALL